MISDTENCSQICEEKSNQIRNFGDVKSSGRIRHLNLDGTMVESMKGILKFDNLKTLSFIDTPLYEKTFARLIAIIGTGMKVEIVNGVRITQMELHEAKQYPPIARDLIDHGWEISSDIPTNDEFLELAYQYNVDFYKYCVYNDPYKLEKSDLHLARILSKKLGSVGLRIQEGPKMKEDIILAIKKLAKAISTIDGDLPPALEEKIHNNEADYSDSGSSSDETGYIFSNEYADYSGLEN